MGNIFFGRESELTTLDRLYQRPSGGQLFVLYGRRRVGKTELINHWLATRGHAHIQWTADRVSSASLLRAFSRRLFAHVNPGITIDPAFSYESWEQAFGQLATLAKYQRLVVVMDEFTYAMASDPSLPSVLQRMWDQHLKRARVLLILSGSHAGMIERDVLAYRSPLYGRATDSVHLKPLPFRDMSRFLPGYSMADRIMIYGAIGGIPMYLEGLDPDAALEDNLSALMRRNVVLDDAGAMLRDQLSEPSQYSGIVENIANGFTTLGEIAAMSNIEEGAASKYVSVLQRLGLVERRVPITVSKPARSKMGRYQVTDPYLRFYFRFISPQRDLIESGRMTQPLANLRQHLPEFVGRHGFEELCREYVLDQADAGKLGFTPRRVGAWWRRKAKLQPGAEIDVAAINEDDHVLLLGECKFTRQPLGARVVRALIDDKAPLIDLPAGKRWTLRYIFFSREGFTDDARAAAAGHPATFVDLRALEAGLR
jgi:AAA+ ATPase superfamily predicted ATPase